MCSPSRPHLPLHPIPLGLCCLFGHSLSSKEQASFNFTAAVTICSDFGAPKIKVSHCFHCFPNYLPWSTGRSYPKFCLRYVKLILQRLVTTKIKWKEKGNDTYGLKSCSVKNSERCVGKLYMVAVKHEVKRATSFFMFLLSHFWLVKAPINCAPVSFW